MKLHIRYKPIFIERQELYNGRSILKGVNFIRGQQQLRFRLRDVFRPAGKVKIMCHINDVAAGAKTVSR